jgi:predicted unusual protein kinase regulating ubiquinone biosynthesis (AarF/ABC1/UbiB family)
MFGGLLGPIGGKFAVKDQIAEMRARFTEELDYRHEAARQREFAGFFDGHPRVRVPAVIDALSARRVLTTELATGLSFDEACTRSEGERRAWAETLWTFVFESLLVHGLFNADPHPGNYLFAEDGRVWFLDFGCTRRVRPKKVVLVRAAHTAAAVDRDTDGLFTAAAEMMELNARGEQGRLGREYIELCFAPLMARGECRITREYTSRLYADMKENARVMLRGKREDFAPLPAEWLFFNRLQLGFYSVLARLDVAVDYNAIERRTLEIGSPPGRASRLSASRASRAP